MSALALRILITALLILLFTPFIVGVPAVAGMLKEEKRNKIKNIIVICAVFVIEFFAAAGMYVLFHDKNIINPVKELFRFEESYRGLLKLTALSIATTAGSYVIYKLFKYDEIYFENRTYVISLVYLIAVLFIIWGLYESLCSDANFKITEVKKNVDRHTVAINGPVYDLSGDSKSVDVVVITNTGLLSNNVSGLFLSDSSLEPVKIRIDDEKLFPMEGYTCVFGADIPIDIKKSGEIYLSDSEGHLLDSFYYENKENDTKVAAPDFSYEGGFYDTPFELTLSDKNDDVQIYYTLDCSMPSVESVKYEKPIQIEKREKGASFLLDKHITPDYLESELTSEEQEALSFVDKATVVRAVAIDEEGNCSDVITHTYFIGIDNYSDKVVASLVMDPADLVGDYGIYVTGRKYDDWYKDAYKRTPEGVSVEKINAPVAGFSERRVGYEREGSFEYISQDGKYINQCVGVKTQGASTRGDVFKRFSIYSRKAYSKSKWFDQELFDGIRTHSFVIRHNFDNAFTPCLVRDRDVAVQDSIPAYVFLNGDFWCATYLQEKYSEEMLSEKYGISEDNIDFIKVGYIENLNAEEMGIYDECIGRFVENEDLSNPDVYREFCNKVDVQSYIDFICTNIYLSNEDYDDGKNFILFRAREKENDGFGDGRLKWGLYDMDLLRNSIRFDKGYEITAMIDTFRDVPPLAGEAYVNKPLFAALMKNDEFREKFNNTFREMANSNFSVENVSNIMQEWDKAVTVENYDEGFFIYRGQYILKYLDEVMEGMDR